MAQKRKQMRNLLGILKDKTSLLKIAFSIKRPIHVAVIRATAHSSNASPPPDHHIDAVLNLSFNHKKAACSSSACLEAILDRLHKTKDVYVALKCLFTLHQIIRRGSFIIKGQLFLYHSTDGRKLFNLSTFRDDRGFGMWQLSEWVRWYANILDHNQTDSRVGLTYFSYRTTKSKNVNPTPANTAPKWESNSDMLRKTGVLVSMVIQLSRAPESLECQRNDLVYEIVNMVGQDHRASQQQIQSRLYGLSEKKDDLSLEEMNELGSCLERLEECRERLTMIFVNRKRNNAFWDLVRETKTRAEKLILIRNGHSFPKRD